MNCVHKISHDDRFVTRQEVYTNIKWLSSLTAERVRYCIIFNKFHTGKRSGMQIPIAWVSYIVCFWGLSKVLNKSSIRLYIPGAHLCFQRFPWVPPDAWNIGLDSTVVKWMYIFMPTHIKVHFRYVLPVQLQGGNWFVSWKLNNTKQGHICAAL